MVDLMQLVGSLKSAAVTMPAVKPPVPPKPSTPKPAAATPAAPVRPPVTPPAQKPVPGSASIPEMPTPATAAAARSTPQEFRPSSPGGWDTHDTTKPRMSMQQAYANNPSRGGGGLINMRVGPSGKVVTKSNIPTRTPAKAVAQPVVKAPAAAKPTAPVTPPKRLSPQPPVEAPAAAASPGKDYLSSSLIPNTNVPKPAPAMPSVPAPAVQRPMPVAVQTPGARTPVPTPQPVPSVQDQAARRTARKNYATSAMRQGQVGTSPGVGFTYPSPTLVNQPAKPPNQGVPFEMIDPTIGTDDAASPWVDTMPGYSSSPKNTNVPKQANAPGFPSFDMPAVPQPPQTPAAVNMAATAAPAYGGYKMTQRPPVQGPARSWRMSAQRMNPMRWPSMAGRAGVGGLAAGAGRGVMSLLGGPAGAALAGSSILDAFDDGGHVPKWLGGGALQDNANSHLSRGQRFERYVSPAAQGGYGRAVMQTGKALLNPTLAARTVTEAAKSPWDLGTAGAEYLHASAQGNRLNAAIADRAKQTQNASLASAEANSRATGAGFNPSFIRERQRLGDQRDAAARSPGQRFMEGLGSLFA